MPPPNPPIHKPVSKEAEWWKKFFRRALFWLCVRVPASGLEVGDHAIRWCRLGGTAPRTAVVKLTPGVVMEGRIIDKPAFMASLQELRTLAFGKRGVLKTDIVVLSMSSTLTFMRLFPLPIVNSDQLKKAVALNIQMLAPTGEMDTSSGWQIVYEDRDQGRFEIAAMFVDRSSVEGMVTACREGGFVVVAAESKAVSLARVVARGQTDLDPNGYYIAVALDDVGLDFVIIRNGVLCFEYALPWHEFADPQGNVSGDDFTRALSRGIRQIENFYQQHWSDVPAAILVAAGNMFDQVRAILVANVSPSIAGAIFPLGFGSADVLKDVPVAFGAALRGIGSDESQHEITFLDADAVGIYEQERSLLFLRFWRVVIPLVLGVVLLSAWCINSFWFSRSVVIENASLPNLPISVASQLATFAASAQTFNQSVQYVQGIESSLDPKSTVIIAIQSLATLDNVMLSQINISEGGPIAINGSASSENAILAFKGGLSSTTSITAVSLPLSAIQSSNGGFTFSITATMQ